MSRSEPRIYLRDQCVCFRKTREQWGGLSNMASGYPVRVGDILVPSSEALYQSMRFPHLPEVQQRLFDQNSSMAAKMASKPYREQSRPDWDSVRVRLMKWCIRAKLMSNWDSFGALLLETGTRQIVEDSHKDRFWGAVPVDDKTLEGLNVLGRLLMELREQLKDTPETLTTLAPPDVSGCLLLGLPLPPIGRDNRDPWESGQLSLNLGNATSDPDE